jgi:hypothetical protein
MGLEHAAIAGSDNLTRGMPSPMNKATYVASAILLAGLLTVGSVANLAAQETVTESCAQYHKFHGNRAAYDAAQKRAIIAECAVLGTQEVVWQRYGPDDPRAQARIAAVKKQARDLMVKHYPKIPDACVDGLLGIGYLVVSQDTSAKQSCTQAAMNKEADRQLDE